MDRIELRTLASELIDDARIAAGALRLARDRQREGSPAALDSSAHHLSRFYNVLEQMGLRITKAFENSLDDEKGWHTELIKRLSIGIPGVRPRLFPDELKQPLHELRAFRHVFVHAYDLVLDPDKLTLVLRYADRVAEHLPTLVEQFVAGVATEQGLEPGSAPSQ